MRIIVNNIAASSGGAMSVLRSFYNYLLTNENAKEHEWIFLLSDNYIPEFQNVKIVILKEKKKWLKKLIFDCFTGRKLISRLKPDVIFSMQNTYTYGLNCPQIVYVHQSLPFQEVKRFSYFNKEERNLAVYQNLIGAIIKKSIEASELIIVQTNWMKDAVIRCTKISNEKVLVAFPYYKNSKCNTQLSGFNNHSFFYPANNSIYKNHECLNEAVNILLRQDINDFEVIRTIEGESNLDVVKNRGTMHIDNVINQYNISTMVFPSYIETVGLPLVEARQVGGLILAADTVFAREVLSGYENAYYFNPFKAEELAELMLKVINGEIAKKSIAYANEYADTDSSWDTVLAAIIKLGNKNIVRGKNDETF